MEQASTSFGKLEYHMNTSFVATSPMPKYMEQMVKEHPAEINETRKCSSSDGTYCSTPHLDSSKYAMAIVVNYVNQEKN